MICFAETKLQAECELAVLSLWAHLSSNYHWHQSGSQAKEEVLEVVEVTDRRWGWLRLLLAPIYFSCQRRISQPRPTLKHGHSGQTLARAILSSIYLSISLSTGNRLPLSKSAGQWGLEQWLVRVVSSAVPYSTTTTAIQLLFVIGNGPMQMEQQQQRQPSLKFSLKDSVLGVWWQSAERALCSAPVYGFQRCG